MLGSAFARSTAYSRLTRSSLRLARPTMTCQAASSRALSGEEASTSGRADRPLLSIAPMMDWTDLHYRQLARLISKHTWLWTEMVVDKTLLHNPNTDKFLWFPPEQHPIVLQLGGSDPDTLAAATRVAAAYGYDEINLNCGCPSDRVAGAGCFGAALMMDAELVAACMAAIKSALGPGTATSVKCRLGVDDADTYAQLAHFVQVVSEKGQVQHFIIHARKCLLRGLNPAQNRSVPPLRHEWVWALKRDFPHLQFTLNGGVLTTLSAADAIQLAAHGLEQGAIHGVMIGRAAYNDPWGVLGDADVAVFGSDTNAATSRRQVIEEYCKYADSMVGRWAVKQDGHPSPSLRVLVKPILNLFHGDKGNKRWKNLIDTELKNHKYTSLSALMAATLPAVPDEVLDAPPKSAHAAAVAAAEGKQPAPYSIAGVLPVPESRAGGTESLKRRRPGQAAPQQQQQQQQVEEHVLQQQDGLQQMENDGAVQPQQKQRQVAGASNGTEDAREGPQAAGEQQQQPDEVPQAAAAVAGHGS